MGRSLEAARMHRLELEPGVTLLQVPSPRSGIVHRLVCDRLADGATGGDRPGRAYWIDARNAASTHALYDAASSPRVLEGRGSRGRLPPTSTTRCTDRRAAGGADDRVARRAERRRSLPRRRPRGVGSARTCWPRPSRSSPNSGPFSTARVLLTSAGDGSDPDATAASETVADYAETEIECTRTREGLRLEDADDDSNAGAQRRATGTVMFGRRRSPTGSRSAVPWTRSIPSSPPTTEGCSRWAP